MRSPRALSSFVALSSGKVKQPHHGRLIGWLIAVCVGLWAVALLPTHVRPLILGLAVLTSVMVLVEKFRLAESLATESPNAYGERRNLIDTLNRHRARVGLESVISERALVGLEASAFQWEQIEAMLATRSWAGQNNLREEVQYSADEYMTQIVAAYLIDTRNDRIPIYTGKLAQLLEALELLDRSVFAYPRQIEVPDEALREIPLLPSPELSRLQETLISV